MAGPDLSVFHAIKTKADYDRLNEEFMLKKMAAQKAAEGNLPAALQIADRITQLRASSDPNAAQQIQDILDAQKITKYDPGIFNQNGVAQEIPNYANVASGIKGQVAGAEQQAEKNVDLVMNPQIARGEADQRNMSNLNYGGQIREEETLGGKRGELRAGEEKKAVNANTMIGILDQAEGILKGRPDAAGKPTQSLPTGSGAGALYAGGKAFFGVSDESTQANRDLEVLSGWLTSHVPRMEGPQSEFDVINYQKMAGDLGNKNIPVADRVSTLNQLRSLQQKYAHLNADSLDPMAASAAAIQNFNQQNPGMVNPNQTMPQAGPQMGSVEDGYMFMGGDPADPNSWKRVK